MVVEKIVFLWKQHLDSNLAYQDAGYIQKRCKRIDGSPAELIAFAAKCQKSVPVRSWRRWISHVTKKGLLNFTNSYEKWNAELYIERWVVADQVVQVAKSLDYRSILEETKRRDAIERQQAYQRVVKTMQAES